MNEKKLKAAIKQLCKENQKIRKDNDGLRKENEKLKKKFDKMKEKFEEYKKRHPKTVGVKHGKSCFFKSSTRSKKQKNPRKKVKRLNTPISRNNIKIRMEVSVWNMVRFTMDINPTSNWM